mmetsp:Transcript_2231/g.9670  ORF Transcript_2231/g.9670 Transcript_2231/m.9670 type:complete len:260 (+) Transcript_2231:514-1293(+)
MARNPHLLERREGVVVQQRSGLKPGLLTRLVEVLLVRAAQSLGAERGEDAEALAAPAGDEVEAADLVRAGRDVAERALRGGIRRAGGHRGARAGELVDLPVRRMAPQVDQQAEAQVPQSQIPVRRATQRPVAVTADGQRAQEARLLRQRQLERFHRAAQIPAVDRSSLRRKQQNRGHAGVVVRNGRHGPFPGVDGADLRRPVHAQVARAHRGVIHRVRPARSGGTWASARGASPRQLKVHPPHVKRAVRARGGYAVTII